MHKDHLHHRSLAVKTEKHRLFLGGSGHKLGLVAALVIYAGGENGRSCVPMTSVALLIRRTHCEGKDPTFKPCLPLHQPVAPISMMETMSPTYNAKQTFC